MPPRKARIPDHVVEQVRDQADLLELVGEVVALKRSGGNHMGLCPLHGDQRTPSLNVRPQHGYFNCFGCGKKGDALAWVMEYHGMPFRDALEWLAGRLGIPLADADGKPPPAPSKEVLEERKARKEVWPVFEEYRVLLHDAGLKEGVDAMRDARGLLERKGAVLPYRAVVVDEA